MVTTTTTNDWLGLRLNTLFIRIIRKVDEINAWENLLPAPELLKKGAVTVMLYSGAASFEGRIWRPHTSQRRVKCCPISKGPSNAAEICSLRFPDLKDASDGSFTAQHIPTFIARWMRQLQRIYFYNIFILWIYIIYYILYFYYDKTVGTILNM